MLGEALAGGLALGRAAGAAERAPNILFAIADDWMWPHASMAGEPVVKTRREASKTRDITGGLPRVSELFEARRPKDAAIVSEIDGRVEFGGVSRGMRKLVVRGDDGDSREYQIPQGRHLHVQEGTSVRAGDRLTEGPINPHDILKIKGIERSRSTW